MGYGDGEPMTVGPASHSQRKQPLGRLTYAAFLAIVGLHSPPAAAQNLRNLCPTRPGLGTASCIVDARHAMVEIGLGEWTLEESPESRTDSIVIGDVLVRYGLASRSEVQIGWTAQGFGRERIRSTGEVTRKSGSGDATIAFKYSFTNPDGSRFSLAAQPFVSMPIGSSPLGGGDWAAGLLVPMSFDLTETLQIQLTPEIGAAVNEKGNGRHFSIANVLGLGIALSDDVSAGLEVLMFHDAEAGYGSVVGASLAWQPDHSFQVDLGANAGVAGATPDMQVYVGVSRRF